MSLTAALIDFTAMEEDLNQQAAETQQDDGYDDEYYQPPISDDALNQAAVMNGIEPAPEGAEMDEQNDSPTPEIQEVGPVTPPPSPDPKVEVSNLVITVVHS